MQNVIAMCRLQHNGTVLCEGDTTLVENLQSGIKDYENPEGEKLYPKDGKRFLEQLKFNFTSGYLNTSDILEDKGSNERM